MTFEEMARLHWLSFSNLRPWSAAEIAEMLASPVSFVLVEASGFLIGRVVAGEAELLTIAVDPAQHRQGIGARLVARFLAEARERRAEVAFLEVAADNLAARGLYGAAGFAETGRRWGYYHAPDGHAVDALILSCRV